MKRNEAILKILWHLQRPCECEVKRAENILIDLENAGLLPPNDGKKRAIKSESVQCVLNAMKCHKWEDENKNDPYINFFV